MRLAGDTFKDLNWECLPIYLDDFIIYSLNVEEHRENLKKLLLLLRKHKLLAKGSKFSVGKEEVLFIGHNVSKGSIGVEKTLIKAVKEWRKQQLINDVQKFLGLSGYYRKLVKGFVDIARPLSDLIRNHRFKWERERSDYFQALKKALIWTPVLAIPRIGVPFKVTTDASKFVVGATMEQEGHPVAYLSHRLT